MSAEHFSSGNNQETEDIIVDKNDILFSMEAPIGTFNGEFFLPEEINRLIDQVTEEFSSPEEYY